MDYKRRLNMLIKYKGQTATLLTQISLELKRPVNLKESELVLSAFFYKVMEVSDEEQSIEVLSNLPPHLKPFYFLSRRNVIPLSELFSSDAISETIRAVMNVLELHIMPENLARIYACFSENLFSDIILLKKQTLQKAS